MEMREAFGRELVELGKQYPNMYVLDGDLNTSTRTGPFAAAHPKRFIQAGIAEQNMIGMAAGLAIEGKIPVACTFASFISLRCLDQISTGVAYPFLNVKIAGAYCGVFASKCGSTHQSFEDIAIFRAMPCMRVADPGDNEELKQIMKAAMDYYGPVYYRITRMPPDAVITEGRTFEWGKGHQLVDGSDLTIVSTGITSQWAYAAAKQLHQEGISARMLHMPSIKPFDEELLVKAASETGRIVTVENHSVIGGLGSAVTEVLSEKCPTRVLRLGIQDRFGDTAPDVELIDEFGMGVRDICATARLIMEK